MTDTDVAYRSVANLVLGGNAIGGNRVVDVRADVVAIAYATTILYDGAVGVGGARDELDELKVNLSGLVHDGFGIALKAEVVHLGNLLLQVLTDVFIQSQLNHLYLCER